MEKNINVLIKEYISGEISQENLQLLNELIRSDAQAKTAFEKILNRNDLSTRYQNYLSFQGTREEDQKAFKQKHFRPHRTISIRLVRRIAAAVLLLVLGGGAWWYSDYTKVTAPEISQEVQLAMQQSQQSERVGGITTSSIKEQEVSQKELPEDNIQDIAPTEEEAAAMDYDLEDLEKITTYHDKEFWVTLDDGTLVHLNYNSRLVYPEKFSRFGKREVILDGEAYFMVAKDRSRKFVVHTPNGDVTVHGTEFNVNTRAKNANGNGNSIGKKVNVDVSVPVTEVVLVKGSVGVKTTNGSEKMMQPGQMAMLTSAQQPIFSQVDVEPYVAWNTGTFTFRDVELEKVMNILCRWYLMEVEYESEDLKTMKLFSDFNRYGDIKPFINGINVATGLNIEIRGNVLIVKR